MWTNLGQIRQELCDYFGQGTNPDEDTLRRYDQFINSVYMELLGRKGTSKLRRGVLTFSSVADDPFAVLPMVATKILTILDRTNNQELEPLSIQQIRRDDPGLSSSSSNPRGYAVINYAAPLAIEPADASELFVKSTSTDDVNVSAFLEGIITGGYTKRVSNKPNGTTAVSLDSTITTWIGAKKFYLDGRAKGDILLMEDSGAGTELARIPQGRTTARYTKIHLHPVPTAVVTYHADVEISVDRLEGEMDEPLLHEDFQWLITSGAICRQMLKDGKHIEHGIEKKRFMDGAAAMIAKLGSEGVSPNRPRQFSQLGPWFPINS